MGATRFFAVCLALGLPARFASGQPPVHGALDAEGLLSTVDRYGAALRLDLLWGRQALRGGLTAGVAALSAGDGQSSQILSPVGLALQLAPRGDGRSGPFATLRVGAAPGAEKGGLTVLGFGACTTGYRFSLGEEASVRLGVHVQYLLGERSGLTFGPTVGLGF